MHALKAPEHDLPLLSADGLNTGFSRQNFDSEGVQQVSNLQRQRAKAVAEFLS